MDAKNTKEISEEREDARKDQTKLRMELESKLDEFLMDFPYDAKQNLAETAIGELVLREKFERVINGVILGLTLKEKVHIAEKLSFQIPVRYAGVEIKDDNKKDPLRRDPSER